MNQMKLVERERERSTGQLSTNVFILLTLCHAIVDPRDKIEHTCVVRPFRVTLRTDFATKFLYTGHA